MDTTIIPYVSRNVEGAVFDAALLMEDEEEREAFLRVSFRGNPEGLARIRRMLSRRGESSAFFLDASEQGAALAKEILREDPNEALPWEPAGKGAEEPGARIGPYVLVSRIGE